MNATTKPKLVEPSNKAVEQRWSKSLATAGWTAFPNIFFQRMKALGVDSLDIVILLQLAAYKWGTEDPHPSKATLARAIGVQPRTVQRRIAAMEKGKFIQRIERKGRNKGNLTNGYNFDGLIRCAEPFAREQIAEIKRRTAENAARFGRKSPLALVKDK